MKQSTLTHPVAARPAATMPAAVLTGAQQIELREVPIPEPKAGEVRVRLEGCGVCASNLPIWEGREWFDYPRAPGEPGHEGWGRIDAVGRSVKGLKEGDRVTLLSYRAFAPWDVAPADAVVRLPDFLNDHPVPGEPLGCAMNVFRRSDIRAGQSVAILGIGFLGALLTGLAKAAGARVFAISRRPGSLEVAREAGADAALTLDDYYQAVDQVQEFNGGNLCDRVIEATGKQGPLDLAGMLTRERGRLIIAGYHQDGLRQVNLQLWNWRGLDVINAHEREQSEYLRGMRDAVEAVTEGRLNPSPLYTHRFPLERLNDALQILKERPEGFVKALVTMEQHHGQPSENQ